MVGLVTSVIICVGSVTSTCFRSSAGDRRILSGPMSPLSSGTLPGQSATTNGSPAAADHPTINETNSAAVETMGCMEGQCPVSTRSCQFASCQCDSRLARDDEPVETIRGGAGIGVYVRVAGRGAG